MSANLAIGIATGYAIGASAGADPMSVEGGKAIAIIMAGMVIAFCVGFVVNWFRARKYTGYWMDKPDTLMGGLAAGMIFLGAVLVAAGVAAVLS